MSEDLLSRSAISLIAALRSGEITARALATASLESIAQLEPEIEA